MSEFIKKQIHVGDLLLDSENPRHDVISNQPEIIQQLLLNEQVLNLAKDIAEQGTLSPLELIGVLQLPGKDEYIVIEGNRRVCACQLLNNPDLTTVKSMASQFKKLHKMNTIPSEIECTVFENREHADHWMQLRHEGQQEGIGTRPWDAKQKARYSEKMGRKNPNIQSTHLLEYAVNEGIIDENKKNSYSITTLQRYLNNPHVRNVFGLKNREVLESNQTAGAFAKLVNRFLEDYRKEEVHSRSKKDDWRGYANLLQKEVADPPEPEAPYVDYTPKNADKQNKKTRITSRPDPTKRKYLIPGDVKFSIQDKTLNRIYWELRKTPVENHEFSVAYLFRAFLEGSTYLYLGKNLPGVLKKGTTLNKKVMEVRNHLRDVHKIKKTKLRSLDLASSAQNSLLSPLILGSMIHMSVIPTKRELINIWDRMEENLLTIHHYLN